MTHAQLAVTGCCIRLAFMKGDNTPNVRSEVAVSDESTVGGNSLLHKVGVNGGGQHPESAQRKSLFFVACVGLPH